MDYKVQVNFCNKESIVFSIAMYEINRIDWENVAFVSVFESSRPQFIFIVQGATRIVKKDAETILIKSEVNGGGRTWLFDCKDAHIYEGNASFLSKMIEFVKLKRKYTAIWRIQKALAKFAKRKGVENHTDDMIGN